MIARGYPVLMATLPGAHRDPASAPASFKPDVPNGTYEVQAVVTDNVGISSVPAFVSIYTNSCGANAPSIVGASANLTSPDPGTLVTLTATGSDPESGRRDRRRQRMGRFRTRGPAAEDGPC